MEDSGLYIFAWLSFGGNDIDIYTSSPLLLYDGNFFLTMKWWQQMVHLRVMAGSIAFISVKLFNLTWREVRTGKENKKKTMIY
jgi:hypothetical protein